MTKKLWAPLGTPDYTPYLAQITDSDVLCQGFAGFGPAAFMKQCASSASNSRWSPAKPAATTRCCTRSATKRSAW